MQTQRDWTVYIWTTPGSAGIHVTVAPATQHPAEYGTWDSIPGAVLKNSVFEPINPRLIPDALRDLLK